MEPSFKGLMIERIILKMTVFKVLVFEDENFNNFKYRGICLNLYHLYAYVIPDSKDTIERVPVNRLKVEEESLKKIKKEVN